MFTSLSRTIGNVFEFSLPMIIISVVVAITLRAADIVKNKKEFCSNYLRKRYIYWNVT